MPHQAIARERLDALGDEAICESIRDGKTQSEIAQRLEVSVGSLNHWLHSTPERSARAREAMSLSAETWLDQGLSALQEAESDQAEIARARAIEQHCARRAAIRDPKRYGDKVQQEHSGSVSITATQSDEKL